MKQSIKFGIILAVLAAALYALNTPFSKLLLEFMPPTLNDYWRLAMFKRLNALFL